MLTTSIFSSTLKMRFCCCCVNNSDDEMIDEIDLSSPNSPHTKLMNDAQGAIPKQPITAAPSAAATNGTQTNTPTTPTLFSLWPNSLASGTNKPRKVGHAHIFHHIEFDDSTKSRRNGSAEDVKLLEKTFKHFQFNTKIYENATCGQVKKIVKTIETTNFDDYACLIIVILSHGSRHEEIAAKDGHYSIDDHILFPLLKNPTLNDKPKLFFIQACKGSMESSGYYKDATPFVQRGSPSEILKCYSTFEGFVSYRTEKGSIFIQTLCQQLKQSGGHTNIKAIMDTVITSVKEQTQNKQIPSYSSTLTKPFVIGDYLKK